MRGSVTGTPGRVVRTREGAGTPSWLPGHDREPSGAKRLINLHMTPPISLAGRSPSGVAVASSIAITPVEQDRDGLPGELLLEVFEELDIVARHDEQIA